MGLIDKLIGKSKNDNDSNSNIIDDAQPFVFIAYSSYDKKIADELCSFLESHKVKCFILPRDVKEGVAIEEQLTDALRKAELILLIYSENSQASNRVNYQIEFAANLYKTILTFNIDGSKLTGMMGFYLMNRHFIEGFPNPERHFNELLSHINQLTSMGDVTDIDLDEVEEEETGIADGSENPIQNVSIVEDNNQDELLFPAKPFNAYSGDKPFIFISYAHKDAELVFKEIKKFHDEGYPVWYDQGLTPGQEWDEEIANALMGCKLLVVFISKNSMASKNVQDEIKLALNEDIDIVPIYFEETELTPALKLRLSTKHAIYKYLSNDSEYLAECFKAFDNAGIPSDENV